MQNERIHILDIYKCEKNDFLIHPSNKEKERKGKKCCGLFYKRGKWSKAHY